MRKPSLRTGFTRLHPAFAGLRRGFTLIELIVVIAIITILVAVVFVALRPADRITDARNTRRGQDVAAISHAAALRLADGENITGVDNSWRMIGTATDSCDVQCGAEAFRGNGQDTAVIVTANNGAGSFNFSQAVTFSFWAKRDGNKLATYLFDSSDEAITYRAAILNGYLSFRLRNTSNDSVIWRSANPVFGDHEFHHVVITLSPPTNPYVLDNISVIVDGIPLSADPTEENVSAALPINPPTDSFRIGGRISGDENFFMDGVIDDFRVYNRGLTYVEGLASQNPANDDEIEQLGRGEEIDDTGLLAHFTFEEGAGSTIADKTGNFQGSIEGKGGWSMDAPSALATTMTEESCIDLSSELVQSRYIPELPVNPAAGNATPSPERTYYAIKKVGAFVAVRSCLFEEGSSSLLGSTPLIESMRGSVLEP